MYKFEDYKKSADYISQHVTILPKVAVILGSGLSSFADKVDNPVFLPYGDIPNFVTTTNFSHKGEMVIGYIDGVCVLLMCGRFHYYEGYEMEQVAYPVGVMKLLGIETLILTNAAGGINIDFNVGDFMLITDHIKLCDPSPMRGVNVPELGSRFFDMSYTYSPLLCKMSKKIANELNIKLQQGVYAYMPGPQFETPAEIRLLRILGGDAVGMSTVSEAIMAAKCGIKVLGISCISNMAAGVTENIITDDKVIEVTRNAMNKFEKLLSQIISNLGANSV